MLAFSVDTYRHLCHQVKEISFKSMKHILIMKKILKNKYFYCQTTLLFKLQNRV